MRTRDMMLWNRHPFSLISIGIVSMIACAWSPLQAAATLVLIHVIPQTG